MLLSDYNAAVQSAPTFPKNVYESRRDRLNELWNKRRRKVAGRSGTPGPDAGPATGDGRSQKAV